jgi:hypothetical protein
MSGTAYLNPVDGEIYPFYELQFNTTSSPSYAFQLQIKVVTPELTEDAGAAQASLESYLAQIAEAVAAMSGVEATTTYVQRYDAAVTVLDSD